MEVIEYLRKTLATAAGLCLVACAGGGSTATHAAPGAHDANGSLTLTINPAPASKNRRPDFLSPSTQSVSITVTGVAAPVVANVAAGSPDCTGTGTARVCTIALVAPTGTDTFTVTLYDGAAATGNVLGVGTVQQHVTAGFTVGIVVNGVVNAIVVSAAQTSFTTGTAATTPITVTATDIGGNTIAGSYASPITLSDTDTTGAFTLSSTSITSSSQAVTLRYSGAATPASATIAATASGVASGNTTPAQVTVSGATGPTITEYLIPTPDDYPYGIVAGPGNAMYFTTFTQQNIGKIDVTTKAFTSYQNGQTDSYDIAVGTDGNLYFTGLDASTIGQLTPGGSTSLFTIPTFDSEPNGIVTGPDGAEWFTEASGDKIGRVTTAGAFAEYALPTASAEPLDITVGPDGALWFTESTGNKIGRITTAGAITEFTIPTANAYPQVVATGPDGALWFTEVSGGKIGRLTTAGAFTEYPLPGNAGVRAIVAGPDGAMWFTAGGNNSIGRITTTGTITEYPIPSQYAAPWYIAVGPDHALWFTEPGLNQIGRVQIGP